MPGERDGIIGFDDEDVEEGPTRGGFGDPNPIGLKGGGPKLVTRTIGTVFNNWTPDAPSPTETFQEISDAPTIADVGRLLNTLPEWGQGGGGISASKIDAGTSPTADLTLTVKLELTMPKWMDYDSASAKAKAEWNRMYRALRDHEEQHLKNVVDVARDLAASLPGKNIDDVKALVDGTSAKIKAKHKAWDTQTNHGKNTGVTLDGNIV